MSFLATPQVALSAASQLVKAVTQPSNNTFVFLVLTALCVIVPLDLTQLIFAVLGAFCYYLVQMLQNSVSNKQRMAKKVKTAPMSLPVERKNFGEDFREARKAARQKRNQNLKTAAWDPKMKQSTPMDTQAQSQVVPVVAPTFQGVGLEAEVQELIAQIMPTSESKRGVDRLAEAIRLMLASTLPEVEVLGFASSDLSRGRANGVAVPDVDIVINVSPAHMASKLPTRLSKAQTDSRMLQKWALRACADKLVSDGGFKFRRSGFRGNEPKITLLVPAELGIFAQAVPVDISVNSVSPLHNAALLTECGSINARAKELILIVRRWAKDRGICHAPKGHLPPYIWSLLTIYFLQVREQGGFLPPLDEFEATSNLLGSEKRAKHKRWSPKEGPQDMNTASLLREFMRFYGKDFSWKTEAICVRRGERGPPPLSLPIHIIEHDDGVSTEAAPSVEDPFSPSQNLGASMTWWSFQRMKEELKRGADLLADEAMSLTQLLEPWTPEMPETPEGQKAEGMAL